MSVLENEVENIIILYQKLMYKKTYLSSWWIMRH